MIFPPCLFQEFFAAYQAGFIAPSRKKTLQASISSPDRKFPSRMSVRQKLCLHFSIFPGSISAFKIRQERTAWAALGTHKRWMGEP